MTFSSGWASSWNGVSGVNFSMLNRMVLFPTAPFSSESTSSILTPGISRSSLDTISERNGDAFALSVTVDDIGLGSMAILPPFLVRI